MLKNTENVKNFQFFRVFQIPAWVTVTRPERRAPKLLVTQIILFELNDQVCVRHLIFIMPSFQPLSEYCQLLKPSLSLREFDGCAGQMPPAEADWIQHPAPPVYLMRLHDK